VLKSFVIGVLVGVLLLVGSVYFYFATGMAPVAAADPPMPFEKKMASKALNAHIDKQNIASPPIPADEPNLVAGAKIYKEQCAVCHGTIDHPSPPLADDMFPHATLMFKGKGVTDDPPTESYWKAANGIRLSGMPGFKGLLTDTQLWQVAQFVANTDKLSDSAKKMLADQPLPASMEAASTPPKTPAKTK